ncbi:MAG: PAS domain S-box protein, partial [Candidatus Aminicenantes bacterium]|nr:PAS domain S-box protein [Candidatus Aminicenantes bacterium]
IEARVTLLKDAGKIVGTQSLERDITERKLAEDELQKSEAMLKEAQALSRIGSWEFDLDSRTIQWSDQVFRLYERDPAMGPPSVEEEAAYYSPEQAGMLREYAQIAGEQGQAFEYDLEARLPSGRIACLATTMRPVRDRSGRIVKLFGTVQDITERKRAEIQIQYQANLLANVSDAILATDRRFNIQYWNTAAEKQYGWTAAEVLGSHFPKFIQPQYIGDSRATVIKKIVQEGFWNGEILHNRRNGALFPVLATISEVRNAENQIIGHITIIRDISERKQAEEQIRAALKEKEVLLQEIHHRVKNNLQIISGLLTLQADQSAGKSLDDIFHASQDRIRSIALIHEKLYRSRNLAEIAFDEYLRTLTENLFISHGVAAGRITVKYEMEPILFTIEKAIPLGLIVNELLTNSLKHAFPAGQQGEIRIGLHGYKGAKSYALKTDSGTLHIVPTCELIVADNGIGFPAGQVPEQEKTLGMKLVSMLAKQLQAELEIKTGPGTEFRLLFPGLPANEAVKDKDHGG